MKKVFLLSLVFFSGPVFSEEYLCSIIVGDRTQTKSYERKGDSFVYTTKGWTFRILHEDKDHVMLGFIIGSTTNLPDTSLFLTIIDKKTLDFSERFISSEEKGDGYFSGSCSLKL